MFTADTEYHPEFHGFSMQIATIRPFPETWGLQLGDILHNFRSALDAAAWAAVTRSGHSLTSKQAWEVRFPCSKSGKALTGDLKRRVPYASPADRAVIRWVQPYRLSLRRRQRHVFPDLCQKNNLDKHKAIQPVLLLNHGIMADQILSRDCIVRRVKPTEPSALEVEEK